MKPRTQSATVYLNANKVNFFKKERTEEKKEKKEKMEIKNNTSPLRAR